MIHHKTAAQINQARSIFHSQNLVFPKQILVLYLPIHMQGDHIGSFQQFPKANRTSVSARQHMRHIMKHHPHAQSLGQIRHLRPDLPVAHNSQRQPAHLVRSRRRFIPNPIVQPRARLKRPPHEQDDLPHRQLGH